MQLEMATSQAAASASPSVQLTMSHLLSSLQQESLKVD